MISTGERAVQNAIRSAIVEFRANLAVWIPQIYADQSDDAQAEIMRWWVNPANVLTVEGAYPIPGTPVVKLPLVVVMLDQAEEVAQKQFLGSSAGTFIPAPFGGVVDVNATWWQTTIACHCMGINYDWVLWAQALVQWALLYERVALQAPPGDAARISALLQSQRLRLTPFAPVPDMLKDSVFPFERSVLLQAQTEATWIPLPSLPISSASMTLTEESG